jgi:vancomycin resistance protein YoaR
LVRQGPGETPLAGYATSLKGRTRGQKHNARLAARALDGRIVEPGAVFSFNRTVKSWSLDQGYVKAPVSFDGELVPAFGGGVCQTSTTLYNAALLAGLPIVERHPHVFAPRYVPPGRDAAVAYPGIDLRFRNPHPWPLRVRVSVEGERLNVRLMMLGADGQKPSVAPVRITTHVLSRREPGRLTRFVTRQNRPGGVWGGYARYLRSSGAIGYRVVTVRTIAGREERLSDDTYPAMDRVVQAVEEDEAPQTP